MSFNTCLFAWKALLTPTIEKIIFLADIVEYRAVKEDVNLRIMDIMAGEGASFAFPSRSIYIENAPSLPDGKGGLQ